MNFIIVYKSKKSNSADDFLRHCDYASEKIANNSLKKHLNSEIEMRNCTSKLSFHILINIHYYLLKIKNRHQAKMASSHEGDQGQNGHTMHGAV